MGIKPDVEIYETENIYQYKTLDEAVYDFSKNLVLSMITRKRLFVVSCG